MSEAVSLTWTPTPGTTSNVLRDGVQIASGLTTGTYTDANVVPGQTYNYTVTATDADGTSTPSNTFTATIPAALTPTTVTATSSIASGLMSKVVVSVSSSSGPVTGNVTWGFQGNVVYTTGLNKQGQASEQIPTLLLKFIPLTLQYQGSNKYAPSTGTVQ